MLSAPDTEAVRISPPIWTPCWGPTRSATWPRWSPASCRELAGRLEALENRVSLDRRALHLRIDTLQAELVARHKSGRASVDGLLT